MQTKVHPCDARGVSPAILPGARTQDAARRRLGRAWLATRAVFGKSSIALAVLLKPVGLVMTPFRPWRHQALHQQQGACLHISQAAHSGALPTHHPGQFQHQARQ